MVPLYASDNDEDDDDDHDDDQNGAEVRAGSGGGDLEVVLQFAHKRVARLSPLPPPRERELRPDRWGRRWVGNGG